MNRDRAVFLDKDGTLVENVPYNVDPSQIHLATGSAAGLRALHAAGYRFLVVSNQSGVARGYFAEEALRAVEEGLRARLASLEVPLDGFYYCPHHPEGSVARYAIRCACRKPAPGMLKHAARQHQLELSDCWMIGDILDDVEAGHRAGCRTILIDNGNETEWILSPERQPEFIAANLADAAGIVLAHTDAQGPARQRAALETERCP